jgi:hypothetical protein
VRYACTFEHLFCLHYMAHRVEEGHTIMLMNFHGLTILPAVDRAPAMSYIFEMMPAPIFPVKSKKFTQVPHMRIFTPFSSSILTQLHGLKNKVP